MNPLPRFLGMALFVVLTALAALVAAPLWHQSVPSATISASPLPVMSRDAAPLPPPTSPKTVHLAQFSQRSVFALALLAVTLAGALVFSLALKPATASATEPPFSATRHEFGTLAKLAESSAAQGVELNRERDVRRRAEEDADLKQELLAQSVDEKIRLGRDLHDGIIQSLYAVGLTLETMRPLLKSDPTKAERRLDEIRANLNTAIRDVRGYITGLAPENLRRASFSRSVTALFEHLRAGRTAKFEINVDDDATSLLTVEQNVEALQIAREAISNALRHGNATHVTIRLHKGDGEVGLLIQDNGLGFDPATTRDGGHGLGNMRARAESLGASLRISSRPGQGVRVIATFPTRESTTA
jgi:signal transduction histidine kinase